MSGERSYVRYPKHCSECSNKFDIEVEITTPEQWKYVQDDVWKAGTCPECWNEPEA